MGTINVRVDEDTERLLREEAASLGLRRSDIVRMALRQWLSLHRAPSYTGRQLLDMARNSIGSVSIDVPDLGEGHEDYLAEAFSGDASGRTRKPVGHERYERVKHLLGSLDSGIDDLGTNHERHLREMFAEDDEDAAGHGATGGHDGQAGSQS